MKKALKKALFIDRDGTLIVEPPVDMQVDSLAKLEFVPGAISALKVLRGLDFELVMATNQDGLGTDSFPEEDFRIPQEKMLRTLAGEGVLFDDMLIDRTFESDGAPTRKPRTGMFGRYTGGGYDLAASYVVGDRATDILLARNLGARGILFAQETAGRRMLREAGAEEACVLISDSWAEIAEYIRRGERRVVVTRETRETRITVRLDLDGKGFGGKEFGDVSADRPTAGTGSGGMESGTDTGNRVGTGADNGPDGNRAGAKNPAGEWNDAGRNSGDGNGDSDNNSDGRNGDNRNRDDGNDNSRINDSSSDERNDDNGNGDNRNCGDGISTGLRFLDHMLAQIAHHGGVALEVEARGDLDIDEHHTMEDVAIVLGKAIDRALGSKAGIGRYGFALPMDDCRALQPADCGQRRQRPPQGRSDLQGLRPRPAHGRGPQRIRIRHTQQQRSIMTAIVDYDTGNLRSVADAMRRIGAEFTITAYPALLRGADRVLLPGVGEASSAMAKLRERGLDLVIPTLTQPVLGICIGMQLLCLDSEEGDARCLGIFPAHVRRLKPAENGLKIPHVGWNTVGGLRGTLLEGIDEETYVYYVHSYAAEVCEATIARTDYGGEFSAALGRGNFFGTQFHPEKSGSAGERILRNFLKP